MNIIQKKIWDYMTKKADDLGHQPAPILENEQERLQDLDALGIVKKDIRKDQRFSSCLLYTSPSPRDS